MSTPLPAPARNRAGFVLVTSLLIMFIMTVMGVTQLRVASKSFQAAGVERDYRQAYNCAHSALETGIEFLRSSGGAQPGCDKSVNNCDCAPTCTDFKNCYHPRLYSQEIDDLKMFGGLAAAGCKLQDDDGNWVTRIAIDPMNPPPSPSQTKLNVVAYRVVAESASVERPDIRVAVSSTFFIDDFAKFVYFTDQEELPKGATGPGGNNQPSITGSSFLNAGDIHTNDWWNGIRIWDATLLGKVSSVCPGGENMTCNELSLDCSSGPCAGSKNMKNTNMLGGFDQGAPQIPLPKREQMASILGNAFDEDKSPFTRSDYDVAKAPQAIKPNSGFFGNAWIKFNLNSDTRYSTTLAVSPTTAFALAIKFDAFSASFGSYAGTADHIGVTPICNTYPAGCVELNGGIAPQANAMDLAAVVPSPDFTGVLLQFGDGLNFLENSLIGSIVIDASNADPANALKWVVVANDRDTLILGAKDLSAGTLPNTNMQLRLVHAPVTVFNAHYNTTTTVPDYWGANDETIASLINKVGRAVNFGWSTDAAGKPEPFGLAGLDPAEEPGPKMARAETGKATRVFIRPHAASSRISSAMALLGMDGKSLVATQGLLGGLGGALGRVSRTMELALAQGTRTRFMTASIVPSLPSLLDFVVAAPPVCKNNCPPPPPPPPPPPAPGTPLVPPIACALNASGTCSAGGARADLVFGVRSRLFSQSYPYYGNTPIEFWNIGSPPNYNVTNNGGPSGWSSAGQGAAAGVNFAGAPPTGLISTFDFGLGAKGCRPMDAEVQAVLDGNGFDQAVPPDPRPYVLPGNCGWENSDIRVWGAVHGRWSLVTMRDIRVIGNRSELPVWNNTAKMLLPNFVMASLHWANGISSADGGNYPMKVWKEGMLPVANSVTGGAQNTIDQGSNVYGVVYANNTDSKDVAFQSHDGHVLKIPPGGFVDYNSFGNSMSDPAPSGCNTVTWPITTDLQDGGYGGPVLSCDSKTQAIPWRDYKQCAGDVLGLFAYQNVLLENPSPQSQDFVGGLKHALPVDMAIEGLIIAAGGMLTFEGYTGHQADPCWPDVANWYKSVDQYEQPGFSNPDRYNHCVVNGIGSYLDPFPMGVQTKVEVLGGQIQKYRGTTHTTNKNEPNINFQYDECFRITGAPPFTPTFPTANSRLDYSRLRRLESICTDNL